MAERALLGETKAHFLRRERAFLTVRWDGALKWPEIFSMRRLTVPETGFRHKPGGQSENCGR